jgi:hypothetical protein
MVNSIKTVDINSRCLWKKGASSHSYIYINIYINSRCLLEKGVYMYIYIYKYIHTNEDSCFFKRHLELMSTVIKLFTPTFRNMILAFYFTS